MKAKLVWFCSLALCLTGLAGPAWGQQLNFFNDVVLRIDTVEYSLRDHGLRYGREQVLPFEYAEYDQEAEIEFFPAGSLSLFEYIKLNGSGDFDIVDSLIVKGEESGKTKIRFRNLDRSQSVNLVFAMRNKNGKEFVQEIKLMPWKPVSWQFQPKDDELFVGESKVFEITGRNTDLIKVDASVQSTNSYDYRLVMEEKTLRLHLLPKVLGKVDVIIPLASRKPFVNERGQLSNDLGELRYAFTVKGTRLAFLGTDKKSVTYTVDFGKGIEMQLENARNLQLKKTYRIEEQIESGGKLIAELYTRTLLSNDRVLCWLRPYALHRVSDGYLYIKDGDDPRFITNFRIAEEPKIERVTILRQGQDWSSTLAALPGEAVELKFEGVGLPLGGITIEDMPGAKLDSALSNENVQIFKFRLPLNIMKRKLSIFLLGKNTAYDLQIREYQEPHRLDFIEVDYGDKRKPITELDKPILYDKTIQDVVLNFRNERIDEEGRLYGKQYLTLTVTIYNNRQQVLESRTVENLVICPGPNSPRFTFYDQKNCARNDISINSLLSRKTNELDDWNRIELVVRHNQNQYSKEGYSRKVYIILQRHTTFDIDVSFPGGLITRNFNPTPQEQKSGNIALSGISIAILGQLSFYKPDKVEKLRPYKIGAGVLALNAFNFNDNPNVQRDLGIVVLGSVFPTKPGAKLSFPLYAGLGYKIQATRWFYMIGPGIQVRF